MPRCRLFSKRQRITGWLLGVAAAASIAGAGVAYRHQYQASLEAVDDTMVIERTTHGALSLLQDAETGQRGFVLTGQIEFLAPYSAAELALPRQLKDLQARVAQSPSQAARAHRLGELTRAKLEELTETIRLRQQNRGDEALAIVKEGRGRRLMLEARAEIAAMLRHEHAQLATRQNEAALALRRLLGVLIGSWILLAVAVGAGLRAARQSVAEATRTAALVESSAHAARTAADNATDLVRIIGPSQTNQLRSILASMGDGVVVLDSDRHVAAINAKAQYFVPWNEGERISKDWAEHNVFLPDGVTPCPLAQAPMTRALLGESTDDAQLVVRATDGSLRTVSINARPICEGSTIIGCVAVLHDVTERHRVMRALSLRDALTGLYNRRGFSEVAEQALRSLARSSQPGCLFFTDLDGLKAINDSLGHETGDRAIADTGRILAGVFRDSDVVARLGGDEFAVLAMQCGLADIPSVLERLEKTIQERNRADSTYHLSLSIGTALFEPPSSQDLNALLDAADQAMYEQKRISKQRLQA